MSTTSELTAVHADALRQDIEPWVERARACEITCEADVASVAQFLRDIKSLRILIASKIDPIVKRSHEAHKAAVALKKELEGPLVESDAIFARKVSAWVEERDREERARLEAEAAERRRLAESAEQAAKKLREIGEEELADLAEAESRVAEPHAPEPTKVIAPGLGRRDFWKAEVTDLMALVHAVASGHVPLSAIQANEKVLGQMARSLKEDLKWPGVRVWSETGIVRR